MGLRSDVVLFCYLLCARGLHRLPFNPGRATPSGASAMRWAGGAGPFPLGGSRSWCSVCNSVIGVFPETAGLYVRSVNVGNGTRYLVIGSGFLDQLLITVDTGTLSIARYLSTTCLNFVTDTHWMIHI